MAIKPILFNTEMVRAILDGRKSCTRRIVKHDVEAILNSPYHKKHPEVEDRQIISRLCQPPYQPGDILYVRETWCMLPVNEAGHIRGHSVYYYKADGDLRPEGWRGKWKPSIHMPKEAARIWLKVTNVRVERLQDIAEDGAKAEGAIDNRGFIHSPENEYGSMHTAREHFAEIWNSTIKKSNLDRCSWDANPWVWIIEFERCEKPVESPYAWNEAIHKLTKGVQWMAKAVLVMDMPECCADCYCGHFERDTKELNLVCGATGEDANNVGKPDWCPLRELPEKANHPDYCDNGRFDKGWNACLDRILK